MTWNTAAKCLRIDEVSDTVTYFGYAVVGSSSSDPVWRIMKMTLIGTETTIEYAGGNTEQTSIWDNRLSYTYS